MKYKIIILLLSNAVCQIVQPYNVNARAKKHAAIPLLLVVPQQDKQLSLIAHQMQKDLSFTQQFNAQAIETDKKEFNRWRDRYPIIISLVKNDVGIAWGMYDATQRKVVKDGLIKNKKHDRAWAHALADDVWQALTGSPGFFSTRIAYCKEVKGEKRRLKHVCIADFDGSNEQVLVDTPTINIAPRWNADLRKPLVFYSEFTDKNVRMMYVDMKKNRHIACDFDGVNMLPSFSQDGTKAVFCASKGKGHPQLFYIDQGKVRQLTNNSGNNFCPALNEDGNIIYFCSDCNLQRPSIFTYDLKKNSLSRIANTSSSESPSYCPQNKKLAYCRSIKGVMQICTYDIQNNKHQQLTFDADAKQGVSWSPCGNYLVYVVQKGKQSLMHMMNVPSKRVFALCQNKGTMSYPAWSPRFGRYPIV